MRAKNHPELRNTGWGEDAEQLQQGMGLPSKGSLSEKLSVGEVQMWESVLRRQPRKKRESRDERDTLRKRGGPQEGSFSLPLCLEDKRHRILQSDLMKYKK